MVIYHGLLSLFDKKFVMLDPPQISNIQLLTWLVDSTAGRELVDIKNLFSHTSLLMNLWLRRDSSHSPTCNANIVQCPSSRNTGCFELVPFLSLWPASGYAGTVPYLFLRRKIHLSNHHDRTILSIWKYHIAQVNDGLEICINC